MGRIIRKENLDGLSLSGRFLRRQARGKQRTTSLTNFQYSTIKQPRKLWDSARKRQHWRDIRFHHLVH